MVWLNLPIVTKHVAQGMFRKQIDLPAIFKLLNHHRARGGRGRGAPDYQYFIIFIVFPWLLTGLSSALCCSCSLDAAPAPGVETL